MVPESTQYATTSFDEIELGLEKPDGRRHGLVADTISWA
jgi:hypothetical protein